MPIQLEAQPCIWPGCGRRIWLRFDGECRYVMELEPGVFKRCGKQRNDPELPVDPHMWFGGYEHIRDERDEAICLCGHPEHNGICAGCYDTGRYEAQVNASHPYQAGMIELDHEARP